MKKKLWNFYHSLIIIPDRLYPFKTQIEGQWVRGIRSYDAAIEQCQRLYGHGHYGLKMTAYRQFFHLTSSIFLIFGAALLFQTYFDSETALYIFLIAGIVFISFQEFYLQRRIYQQLWRKGIIDWLAWCVPAGIYLFILFY